MNALALVVTTAGFDALVDAQNGVTEAVRIAAVGLTETAFDAAPTLTALPGEIKRLTTLSGQSTAANMIHMTAHDAGGDVYDLRGLAFYLEDGTLFGSYGQATPLFRKVANTAFLLAFDVVFTGEVADSISFGDSTFLYPPATETVRGVARIATQARVDAEDDGEDDAETIVTPKTLRARLAAFFASVEDALAALLARTITGAGLATGGGNLTASRTIMVAKASGADIAAGDRDDAAITPAALAAVPQTFGGNLSVLGLGGAIIKTGTASIGMPGSVDHIFPVAFPTACDRVLISPLGNPNDGDESDEPIWISGMSQTGFSVASGNDGVAITFAYLAIGH